MIINAAFIIFNGVIGIVFYAIWNGAICVYYIILAGIRGWIIFAKKHNSRRIYKQTHILLILMNLAMIVPIALMINGEKEYTYGLIPAIAMAVYTTYRITVGIIQFRRSRKNSDYLIRELRTINMIDALVAILTLQSSMIMANGGITEGMKTLMIWSSTGVFILMTLLTINSFVKIKQFAAPNE